MNKHSRKYENLLRHKDCKEDDIMNMDNSMGENYPIMPIANSPISPTEMPPMDPTCPSQHMGQMCPIYHMGSCPMAQMHPIAPVPGMQHMPMMHPNMPMYPVAGMQHMPMHPNMPMYPVAGMQHMPMHPNMPMMHPVAGMYYMNPFLDDDDDDNDDCD